MDNVFTQFKILPSYATGFTFTWSITGSLRDPLPWRFIVEEAQTDQGDWLAISPELINKFVWADDIKRIVNKDRVLTYRVKMTTPKREYISSFVQPYAVLNRREFFIVQDIMRRELLQQRDMAGLKAKLWIRSVFGPTCTYCVDPITGGSISSNCKYCLGIGRLPPYHGPYPIWATLTSTPSNPELKTDGAGLNQTYEYQLRIIGYPPIKDMDILIDDVSDKRYIVDGKQNIMELRNTPVVQIATVKELPVTDPFYRWDTKAQIESGCVFP